jgi:hypothetical protein
MQSRGQAGSGLPDAQFFIIICHASGIMSVFSISILGPLGEFRPLVTLATFAERSQAWRKTRCWTENLYETRCRACGYSLICLRSIQ